MSKLSDEQREFLQHHNIPVDMVFDATGLKRKDWTVQMKQLGLRFAFGVGPCKKGNHTLRTLGGNCIQCKPADIAFTNRHFDDGFVYIAYSFEQVLLKVGVAVSVIKRVSSLNNLGYAGANDWKALQSIKAKRAGEAEFAIHSDLSAHHVKVSYLRDGNPVDCREVFRCCIADALDAFNENTGACCGVDDVDSDIVHRFME
jgi:hypothetical protein